MTVTIAAKPFVQECISLKYKVDSFNTLYYLPFVLNGSQLYAQLYFGMVGEMFSGSNGLLPLFA